MPPLTSLELERLAALRRRIPRAVLELAENGHLLHLVGGAIRDALLGRPARDLDLITERSGEELARRLATSLPARLVLLGGERFAAFRLVRRESVLDLWDREGAPLTDDLARRDLTVDAIALPLARFPGSSDPDHLIDPFGGLEDLRSGRLRATTSGVFHDDPQRVLRLARLAAELPGFAVEAGTVTLARAASVGLSGVAPERLREELERLLECPNAAAGLAVLGELGADWALFGKTGPGRAAAAATAELASIAGRLATIGLSLTPRDLFLLRLALLALSCGADEAARLLEHLAAGRRLARLDAKEATALIRVAESVTASSRLASPAGESLADDIRADRRLLHAAGTLWRATLTLLACVGGLDDLRIGRLLELERTSGAELRDPTPLLRGQELAEIAALSEGRALGRLVSSLRSAQVDGVVATRDEAIAWVERHCRPAET